MKVGVLVAMSLITQYLMGWPGVPLWVADLKVPMVFLVAAVMLFHGRKWPFLPLALGLGWDLLMEGVIGPGGIAWGATALVLEGLATVVADRQPRTWAVFGALGGTFVLCFRFLTLLPLGLSEALTLPGLLRVAMLTGLWCGLVGWIIELNPTSRWAVYRARRLR